MKWLGVVGLLVFVPNVQAAVIYNDNFESGKTIGKLSCIEKNIIQGNIVRSGNKAAKLVSKPNKGKRCEITALGKGDFHWGQEYWTGYSFYIPSNLPNSGYGIFHQHHSAPPKGSSCPFSGGNGFTLLRGKSGKLEIRLTPSKNLNARNQKSAGAYQETAYSFPYQTNKWFDIVMNFKYSDKSDGFWKIWINGKQVINRKGSNVNLWMTGTSTGVSGCTGKKARYYYIKYGTYVGNSGAGAIYYDEIKIGNANSSYAEVAPGERGAISGSIPVTSTSPKTPPRSQVQPKDTLAIPKNLKLEIN